MDTQTWQARRRWWDRLDLDEADRAVMTTWSQTLVLLVVWLS